MNWPKLVQYVLLLGPLFSVSVSCKKAPEVVVPAIVGKWQQQAYQYRIVYEVNGSRYDKTGTRTLTQGGIFEFKADGTATERNRTYTYTQSGDRITLRYGTDTETGNVILTGDQLTLSGIDNMLEGLSEADKLKEAKGWAIEVNGTNGGNGVYTDINKATKAYEVYSASVYQRVK